VSAAVRGDGLVIGHERFSRRRSWRREEAEVFGARGIRLVTSAATEICRDSRRVGERRSELWRESGCDGGLDISLNFEL
jgi:hypothetical protein